jgi:hypothetical protein
LKKIFLSMNSRGDVPITDFGTSLCTIVVGVVN